MHTAVIHCCSPFEIQQIKHIKQQTGERSGFDAWSRQAEMTLGIVAYKQKKSTGDDEFTLALKPTGRVSQNLNKEYQWAIKMDLSATKT